MVKTQESILTAYQNDIQVRKAYIATLKRKLNTISLSRLGLFVFEILIIALIISQGYHWAYGILLVIPVILFMILIKKQVAIQTELEYTVQLLWICQNEEDLILHRKNGYADGSAYADEYHSYSSDLDIFGSSSLYAYINRCSTARGRELLADSLSAPGSEQMILERQEAIQELVTHIEDTFHFRAKLHNHKPEQLKIIENALQHQLKHQLEFTRKKFLRVYVAMAPFLTIGLFILGMIFGGPVWNIFGLVMLFNAGFTFLHLNKINQVYYGFSGSASLLRAFSGTIEWTENISWKSKYIKSFFENSGDKVPLSKQIRQLSSIIQAFDARLNIIVSAVLNLFLLWDLRCSIKLEKWYASASDQLLKGLYRISQFEELISFATLTHNEPSWNFPGLSNSFGFNATALGHPLIREEHRIINDFNLENEPTVDIVTGSNMAGKSTFLRTVGINMILAFAGGPVCAKQLNLSIFKVLSYMRIKDSLNDQTSTFKAELNRLKMILDTIQNSDGCFVLIDEMLRGTNSRDKYLGSKVFIEKMITQHTPALFATHDLQLSEMKETYATQIRNYHFDIQITDDEMHFDYKLKYGACKTFNAAILLKQIGLVLNQGID